jgi:hypothetical protein
MEWMKCKVNNVHSYAQGEYTALLGEITVHIFYPVQAEGLL